MQFEGTDKAAHDDPRHAPGQIAISRTAGDEAQKWKKHLEVFHGLGEHNADSDDMNEYIYHPAAEVLDGLMEAPDDVSLVDAIKHYHQWHHDNADDPEMDHGHDMHQNPTGYLESDPRFASQKISAAFQWNPHRGKPLAYPAGHLFGSGICSSCGGPNQGEGQKNYGSFCLACDKVAGEVDAAHENGDHQYCDEDFDGECYASSKSSMREIRKRRGVEPENFPEEAAKTELHITNDHHIDVRSPDVGPSLAPADYQSIHDRLHTGLPLKRKNKFGPFLCGSCGEQVDTISGSNGAKWRHEDASGIPTKTDCTSLKPEYTFTEYAPDHQHKNDPRLAPGQDTGMPPPPPPYKSRQVLPMNCPSCDSESTLGRYHKNGWREYVCSDCGHEFKTQKSKTAAVRLARSIKFHPQKWVNDYAVAADPRGETEWQPSPEHIRYMTQTHGEQAFKADSYESDEWRYDPAAPQWVKDWDGPFYLEHKPDEGDPRFDKGSARRHPLDPRGFTCKNCGNDIHAVEIRNPNSIDGGRMHMFVHTDGSGAIGVGAGYCPGQGDEHGSFPHDAQVAVPLEWDKQSKTADLTALNLGTLVVVNAGAAALSRSNHRNGLHANPKFKSNLSCPWCWHDKIKGRPAPNPALGLPRAVNQPGQGNARDGLWTRIDKLVDSGELHDVKFRRCRDCMDKDNDPRGFACDTCDSTGWMVEKPKEGHIYTQKWNELDPRADRHDLWSTMPVPTGEQAEFHMLQEHGYKDRRYEGWAPDDIVSHYRIMHSLDPEEQLDSRNQFVEQIEVGGRAAPIHRPVASVTGGRLLDDPRGFTCKNCGNDIVFSVDWASTGTWHHRGTKGVGILGDLACPGQGQPIDGAEPLEDVEYLRSSTDFKRDIDKVLKRKGHTWPPTHPANDPRGPQPGGREEIDGLDAEAIRQHMNTEHGQQIPHGIAGIPSIRQTLQGVPAAQKRLTDDDAMQWMYEIVHGYTSDRLGATDKPYAMQTLDHLEQAHPDDYGYWDTFSRAERDSGFYADVVHDHITQHVNLPFEIADGHAHGPGDPLHWRDEFDPRGPAWEKGAHETDDDHVHDPDNGMPTNQKFCLLCKLPIAPTEGAVHRPDWDAHMMCVLKWKQQNKQGHDKQAGWMAFTDPCPACKGEGCDKCGGSGFTPACASCGEPAGYANGAWIHSEDGTPLNNCPKPAAKVAASDVQICEHCGGSLGHHPDNPDYWEHFTQHDDGSRTWHYSCLGVRDQNDPRGQPEPRVSHVGDDGASHHSNPQEFRTEHPYFDECPDCVDGLGRDAKPCGTCSGLGEAWDQEYWDGPQAAFIEDFANYPNIRQVKPDDKFLREHVEGTHGQKDYEDPYTAHTNAHGMGNVIDPDTAKIIFPELQKAAHVGTDGFKHHGAIKCPDCAGTGGWFAVNDPRFDRESPGLHRRSGCFRCKGAGILLKCPNCVDGTVAHRENHSDERTCQARAEEYPDHYSYPDHCCRCGSCWASDGTVPGYIDLGTATGGAGWYETHMNHPNIDNPLPERPGK